MVAPSDLNARRLRRIPPDQNNRWQGRRRGANRQSLAVAWTLYPAGRGLGHAASFCPFLAGICAASSEKGAPHRIDLHAVASRQRMNSSPQPNSSWGGHFRELNVTSEELQHVSLPDPTPQAGGANFSHSCRAPFTMTPALMLTAIWASWPPQVG
jgi:hypothetical protein